MKYKMCPVSYIGVPISSDNNMNLMFGLTIKDKCKFQSSI